MNPLEKIISDMPNGLDDLEKARYFYLEIAELFSFSTKLNNTSENEFVKMYNESYNLEQIKNNQIICKNWAAIYSYLLNRVGIKNTIIKSGHEYVEFEYNDKIWFADATTGEYTDLARIKFGDETFNFGVAASQKIEKPIAAVNINDSDNSRIKEIDKKFTKYQNRKDKMKILISKLKEVSTSNLSPANKVSFLFKTIGTLSDGYYESKDFVRDIENYVLSAEEKKNIKGVELKRTNKNGYVDIIQCLCIKNNDEYDYYLLAPNMQVREVKKDDIMKLSLLGYGLDNKNIPGINYPKVFKPGISSKKSFKCIFIKTSKELSAIKEYDKEQITYYR